MGTAGEVTKEGLKYKSIRYIVIILVIIGACFIFYRLGKNNAEDKPLLSGFLPEKTPEKAIKGNNNVQTDKIEKVTSSSTQGVNSPIITTNGKESPIMNGKGDYKPSKTMNQSGTTYQNKIQNKDSGRSHVVNGAMYGGVNGDVNTIKVPLRYLSDQELNNIKERYPDSNTPVTLREIDGDPEVKAFAENIRKQLNAIGYNNVREMQVGQGETCPDCPNSYFISYESNSIRFYIWPQKNYQ